MLHLFQVERIEFLFLLITEIYSIIKTALFVPEQPFGEIVDMASIDRFWSTIGMRNEEGLWLAERYLE